MPALLEATSCLEPLVSSLINKKRSRLLLGGTDRIGSDNVSVQVGWPVDLEALIAKGARFDNEPGSFEFTASRAA